MYKTKFSFFRADLLISVLCSLSSSYGLTNQWHDTLCLQYWNESNFELIDVVKDYLLVQRNFESANESLVPISKRSSFRASNTSVPTSGKREVRRARTHFQALSWCRNTTSVSLSTNKCSTTALLRTTARSLTTVSSSESVSCKFLEIMNLS